MDESTIRGMGNNDVTLNSVTLNDETFNSLTLNDGTLRSDAKLNDATNITLSHANAMLDVTGRMDDDGQSQTPNNDSIDTDTFEINNTYYRKVRCLSDNSGEAQVFLVENNGELLVLKIYYPNFTVKKKLLKIIAGIGFEMIVQVYDFGKMYVGGVSRDYELMEYLRGGTLSTYKLNGDMNRFRRIALQAAAALEYCHNNNVIHKDIKPGNFFFRDEEQTQLVLGDFGISSVVKDKDELHRTTQARTPIYASPEMYNDVIDGVVEITPATDYYSLGITLLTLWRGNSPFNVGERTIIKRKNEGRLPGIDSLPDRVKMIVKGLTSVNVAKRWTYNEVERWFLGENPEVDLSSPFLRYQSFIVDPERNLVAENVQELIPLLLSNERIARGYLYGGRLANWFDSCGNSKTAMQLKDIVTNRYPADQHAGLMAAIYTMDHSWPYTDINGQECNDIHSVAVSMVINSQQYQIALRNPHDNLWVYVESHTDCDVNRMRGYFTGVPNDKLGISILRSVYEMDKDMPFFTNYKSRTLKEIIHCFGYENMSKDDWRSITDGRLLSWMYSHEDRMACESLRIMTEGKEYSKTLAYKVLYNVDRTTAFDLRGANTPAKVGALLAEKLKQWQSVSDEEFAKDINDFCGKDGRFLFYAQLHGWSKQIHECNRCFDIKSDENHCRLGFYDLRVAAYRFCRILDTTPSYLLPSGKVLDNGNKLEHEVAAEMSAEINKGSLMQWLAVFFHENPYEDFSQEYSYEKSLEKWILAIGSIDPQQNYFRRYVKAKDETSRKYDDVRREYRRAKFQTRVLKQLFYAVASILAIFFLVFGFKNRDAMLDNGFMRLCLPIGLPTALIVGVKSYFKGFGVMMSAFFAAIGFVTSFIPLLSMRWVNHHYGSLLLPLTISFMLIYVIICWLTDDSKETEDDKALIAEVMDDDMKSSLLEPLYYTFKTKAQRFKGSKFGVLDDVKNQLKTMSSESLIHYALWSLLALSVLGVTIVNEML